MRSKDRQSFYLCLLSISYSLVDESTATDGSLRNRLIRSYTGVTFYACLYADFRIYVVFGSHAFLKICLQFTSFLYGFDSRGTNPPRQKPTSVYNIAYGRIGLHDLPIYKRMEHNGTISVTRTISLIFHIFDANFRFKVINQSREFINKSRERING